MNKQKCGCGLEFPTCEEGIQRRQIIKWLYELLQHPGFRYLPQTARDAIWARYEYHVQVYYAHMRAQSTRAHQLFPGK